MDNIDELRQAFYNAISMLDDKKMIMDALPKSCFSNYFEIMAGLIENLEFDIETTENDFINEIDKEYKEMYKEELSKLLLKKKICEQLVEEAKSEENVEKEFTNVEKRHIIFALRNSGRSYFEQDIKDNSFSEEYYGDLIELIETLENGVEENNIQRARIMVADDSLVGVHEVKAFKIRVYYEILSPNLAYVFLTKLKKSDNSKRDKQAIQNRKNVVQSEFDYLKELIKNEDVKMKLIEQHDRIKEELLDYLYKNQRGDKVNEK